MLTENNPSVRIVEQFLEPLHGLLGADERLEVRDKAPADYSPMHQNFFPSVKEAANYAVSVSKTRDVYVGVALRRGENGTKRGVSRISATWGDLDAKDGHTRESRMRQLMDLPYHPSIMVWTGGGWHAYWLLKRPVAGPEELDLAELTMRRLARVGLTQRGSLLR